jgi:hypothetical protein
MGQREGGGGERRREVEGEEEGEGRGKGEGGKGEREEKVSPSTARWKATLTSSPPHHFQPHPLRLPRHPPAALD